MWRCKRKFYKRSLKYYGVLPYWIMVYMPSYVLFLFSFWCDLYHFLLYLLPWCLKSFICKSIVVQIRGTQFVFLYELWLLLFFLRYVALFVWIIFSVSHVSEKKLDICFSLMQWTGMQCSLARMGNDLSVWDIWSFFGS